jgi:hypothetical protein
LHERGWTKTAFRVEKKINDETTFSQTHEVDHVKASENGTIALEIEWNNKDPFFDRDLENFNRRHADGAISIGVIVTRGASLQQGLPDRLARFAIAAAINSFDDLAALGLSPTRRQRGDIERFHARHGGTFAEAWATRFFADKFGAATTHWSKLVARIERGVGSPCPIVALGLPHSCLVDGGQEAHI